MASAGFEQVSKWFGQVVALSNLTLEARDGEFLVLVGPSGCGKTTALRCLSGLDEPDAGRVFIGDSEVTYVEPKDRDVAMVFQNYALYPYKSVRDNIGFPLKMRKVKKSELRQRVDEVAAMLGIGELLERKPGALSGGQRQRVALARAIVREPAVFLMDEPLSNLDAQLRAQTRTELIQLQRRLGTTTMYVTHDQVEAMTMGQRIAVMRDGILQQVAGPLEIYSQPANSFVAAFIGNPPMNLLTVTVDTERGALLCDDGELPLSEAQRRALAGREQAIAGIRPEHLFLFTGAAPDERYALRISVDVIEELGSDTFVWSSSGNLRARVPPEMRLDPGDRVAFAAAPDAIHLFDAASGARIDIPGQPAMPSIPPRLLEQAVVPRKTVAARRHPVRRG